MTLSVKTVYVCLMKQKLIAWHNAIQLFSRCWTSTFEVTHDWTHRYKIFPFPACTMSAVPVCMVCSSLIPYQISEMALSLLLVAVCGTRRMYGSRRFARWRHMLLEVCVITGTSSRGPPSTVHIIYRPRSEKKIEVEDIEQERHESGVQWREEIMV